MYQILPKRGTLTYRMNESFHLLELSLLLLNGEVQVNYCTVDVVHLFCSLCFFSKLFFTLPRI